jgi:hypothetical protein
MVRDFEDNIRQQLTTRITTIMGLTWPDDNELERQNCLPEILQSTATLELIGFSAKTAREILERFEARPNRETNPHTLIGYVSGHLEQYLFPDLNNPKPFTRDEALLSMERAGLSEDFQSAITDPRFSYIAGTQTLQYWIEDTLHLNYITVQNLTTERQLGQPTISTSSMAGNRATPELPDHYYLYKVVTAAEILPMSQGKEPTEICWIGDHAIRYTRGEDLAYMTPAYYWTPELKTAVAYKEWLARRCPYSGIAIVRIELPKDFIDTLCQRQLWYSADWKEYVWHCQNRVEPSRRFHSYECGVDLVKGHISIGMFFVPEDEVQTGVSKDNVLTVEGHMATQWAFMGGYNRDIDAMIRSITVSFTPPTTTLKV